MPVVTAPPTPVFSLAPGATPTVDIGAILNGEITIFNLSDVELTVSAVIHDPSTDGEDIPIADFTLGPSQVTARSVIGGTEDSGGVPYALQFTYAGGSTVGGACTLNVLAGQAFTFVAVNDGLVVTRGDEVPASVDETVIATSPLCIAPSPSVTP